MSRDDEFDKYEIKKNQPEPIIVKGGWARVADKWDRLIATLEAGDEWRMKKREAISFSNRAKKAGFVVVSRKVEVTEQEVLDGVEEYIVWFGGLKK